MPHRRPPTRLALGLAAVLVLLAGVPSGADVIEDDDLNYSVEIPNRWSRLPTSPSWQELGIVLGAVRELREQKNGGPTDGEGAMLHLAITKMPEGKTLDDLAKDPEVQGFLMNRFAEDPASWPGKELISDNYDGLEIRILRTEGKAPNLKGKEKPARGVMLMTAAKGRLYQLRMYAWPTEFDAEGLKDDLDLIEMNFYIPDTTPEEEPAEKPPPPPAEDEEPEDAPEGDEAEEKVFEGVAGVELETAQEKYRFVKPKGLKSKEDYNKADYKDVVAWFEDNDNVGSYQIMFYMIPKGRKNKETGQNVPDIVLEEWALDDWWDQFMKDHPDGPVWTYDWPRRSDFLSLPDWEDQRDVASEPRRRPTEADANDLIKKLRVVERDKNARIGRDKPQRAYRGVLEANRARVGREIVVKYLWETPRVSCYLYVSFARDARMKWSDEVEAFLASIEMLGRP